MDKYVCEVCGYVYDPAEGDPDNGVAAGTKFEDLPDDWVCPVCGADKDSFAKEAQYSVKPADHSAGFLHFEGVNGNCDSPCVWDVSPISDENFLLCCE